jgi:signal transduction histidine kinase/ActR/RegA family two-component response regulator
MRCNDWVLGSGAGAIMLGYTTLLIYYAVASPSTASQSPIGNHLQDATIQRIEDNIVNFLNGSSVQTSTLAKQLAYELRGTNDSWSSLTKVQGELWGAIAQNTHIGNTIFQSTTNLSTSYFRNDTIYEYSRVEEDLPGLQSFQLDNSGHRTDAPPSFITSPPLHNRTWFILGLAMTGSVAVSSTVGIFGTPLVTFSSVVWDGQVIRGVVSTGYAVPQINGILNRVDPAATIYLLTTDSLRLISFSSDTSNTSGFQSAANSSDPVIAQSAIALNASLLDSYDHRGTLSIRKRRYIYAIRKFRNNFNTTVVSLVPRDYLFKQVDESRRVTVGVFVAALVLWLLFASTVGAALYKTRRREHAHLARAEKEEHLRLEKQSAMARLSHELRTPMAAMIGLLDVLDGECSSAEQKAHVSLLQKTSSDMMQLLDGLLLLARADAGKSNVEEQVFNLRRELEAAIASIGPLTCPRGIKASLWYEPNMVDEFLGDRRKIRQILDNLLSNSAKFTDAGHIRVSVSKGRFVLPYTQFVDVRVEDTGCGIPENRIEEIFQEFVQGNPGIRSKYGGSGLGLSIVRSLCKLMGGDIEVESNSPSGTCFHFWLRLANVTSFRKSVTVIKTLDAPNPLRGLHILVAEDTRLLSKLIERLLVKEGAEVTLTADGIEVVDAYRATPVAFSAILMDLQMPRMDGYDATKTIRRLEQSSVLPGRIPIIALTAHAMDSDAAMCKEVGMDDYLRKPLDRATIVATLLRRCKNRDSPRTPEPTALKP